MGVLSPCRSRGVGDPVVSCNPLALYVGPSLSGYCPMQYCRNVVSFGTLTPFVPNRRARPIVPWWRGTFARSLGWRSTNPGLTIYSLADRRVLGTYNNRHFRGMLLSPRPFGSR